MRVSSTSQYDSGPYLKGQTIAPPDGTLGAVNFYALFYVP